MIKTFEDKIVIENMFIMGESPRAIDWSINPQSYTVHMFNSHLAILDHTDNNSKIDNSIIILQYIWGHNHKIIQSFEWICKKLRLN